MDLAASGMVKAWPGLAGVFAPEDDLASGFGDTRYLKMA
jgi:hypothetical protein